jgi:hypothetical protein
MRRRYLASWLPLLAALVATPILSGCPGNGQPAAQAYHPKPLPDYSPYHSPSQEVKAKPPTYQDPGTTGRPLPGYQAPKFFESQHNNGKQPGYSSFIAGSYRHFTLFPTGPPHHH